MREEDSLVPGNFAEWHNNVSYATFPDWRAVARARVGSSEIPVENGEGWNGDVREEQKEEREREVKRTERVENAVAVWHAIRG